jgi:hypothetical protein
MAYSDFTLNRVKQQFGLNINTGVFFTDPPKLPPREWLTNLLNESVPFVRGLGNEKARSELIVAPLLFEFRELLDRQIGLFSGTDFSVDVESGLSGACDFLLTRSKSELIIEDPAVIVIVRLRWLLPRNSIAQGRSSLLSERLRQRDAARTTNELREKNYRFTVVSLRGLSGSFSS